MSITDSNTYVEVLNTTNINTGRSQYNNTLKALLVNFASDAVPADNINVFRYGSAVGIEDGTIHYNTERKALYISDEDLATEAGDDYRGPGGYFTRKNMLYSFDNINQQASEITSIATGELFSTVSSNSLSISNGRLYLTIANSSVTATNSSTSKRYIDVGIPPVNSIATSMLKNGEITESKFSGSNVLTFVSNLSNTKIASKSITKHEISVASSLAVLPIGSILIWSGGLTIPNEWRRCGGASLDSVTNTDYAPLYSIIGTSYGGTGPADFNLPNFEARFPIGLSSLNNYSSKIKTTSAMASSGLITSDTKVFPISTGTSDAQGPIVAKDVSGGLTINVIDSVIGASHNHDIDIPKTGVYFIIKVL